jgi:fructose-specific phosphotransferase system IIA component
MGRLVPKLAEMLTEERIIRLKSQDKEGVLRELCEVIARAPEITDKDDFYQAIVEREKILSTGIGLGVAVPHAKIASVKDFVMAVGVSDEPIDFDALDGKPVRIFVLIGSSDAQKDLYVRVLAKVAMMLKNSEVRDRMLKARQPSEIMDILREH